MTLKSRSSVTQGHWKRNHWVDRTRLTISRVNVEYYRDFEMWVKGHSRPLKVVPFKNLGTASYSPSLVTMAVYLAISEIFSVKEWSYLEILVWPGRSRSLEMARSDGPCMTFYWSAIATIFFLYIVPFSSYLTLNNTVTLKSGLEVTLMQVIQICAIRKLGCGFLFAFYSKYGHICSRLWDI